MRRSLSRWYLWVGGMLVTGCVIHSAPLREPVEPQETGIPVQAYLPDGSIVRYEQGFELVGDTIVGWGIRYDPALHVRGGRVDALPLDSVVGMETLQARVNVPATVGASVLVGAGITFGAAALSVAIFGSCPTVYVPSSVHGDTPVAELFSHSVSPLLEGRDLDVLPAMGLTGTGTVRLDLRNEAMETHFINHLELVEVQHGTGEVVLPDHDGLPVVLSGWMTPSRLRDREGRDVSGDLRRSDGAAFATAPERVAMAGPDDLNDFIELEVPRPAGRDSMAVALQLRNSLLSTVLLYDFVLTGDDLRGFDWLGRTVQEIGSAATMGAWFQERMGLRVEVWNEDAWHPVARVPDTGPIAWKETAVVLPVPDEGATVRIRLNFLVDHWRIDGLRVASMASRPALRSHEVARIIAADGSVEPAMREAVLAPDESYLETRPGTALYVEFEAGPHTGARTFLLGSQGYYTEWIRPDWIRAGRGTEERFVPGDEGLVRVLARWQERRAEMEEQFHDSRLATQRGGAP